MSKRKVRVSVILGFLDFIKKRWGEDGVTEVAKERNFEPTSINDGEWYDIELDSGIREWIMENKGVEFIEMCGNYTVKNLGLLSYIVRFDDIGTTLKRLPENYAETFNFGSLEVEMKGGSYIIIMKDAFVDEYHCIAWLGVFKGILDITKKRGTVSETQCVKDGATHCEFLVEWE